MVCSTTCLISGVSLYRARSTLLYTKSVANIIRYEVAFCLWLHIIGTYSTIYSETLSVRLKNDLV